MTRYVAFLRGINVGGHTVTMDRLRELFASAGMRDVGTYIASGNVLFTTESADTTALEELLEAHVGDALGFPTPACIRRHDEVVTVAGVKPFPEDAMAEEGAKLHIGFLKRHPTPEAADAFRAMGMPGDLLEVSGRELYWLRQGRMTDTQLKGPSFDRVLEVPVTVRTANTVRRIAGR